MKLVFNPSLSNSLAYGDGRDVYPSEFAYVDETEYPAIDAAIEEGLLVEKPIPDEIPPSLSPGAVDAVTAAVNDRKESEKSSDKGDQTGDKDPVSNTGSRRSSSTTTKTKGA